MATSSSVVNISSFGTTQGRLWGAAMNAALTAAGLTQTSDTGQANWSTVTFASTSSTVAGYEIWRFNDTLQSTAPVFLKLSYGTGGSNTGADPNLSISVGTGSDGAGNLTGNLGGLVGGGNTLNGAATATSMPIRASWSTSAGAAFIDAGFFASNYSNTYVVARTCDSSGNPTAQGLVLTSLKGSTQSPNVDQMPFSFSPYAAFATRKPAVGGLTPSGGSSVSGGGVIELYRNWATIPTPVGQLGSLGYWNTDITAGAVFVAAPFGSTTHTYLALTSTMGAFEQGGTVGYVAAVIWE